MSFETGLSQTILKKHFSLTADALYYTTSETTRVNVRTAIDDLISRVTALENNQPGPESVPKYIFLNGESDIVFSSGADDLLDWTKSWSLGLDIVYVPGDWATDNAKMSIFSSGGSHLTLQRAGSAGNANMASYNSSKEDLYHTNARAQANTWVPITADSRILYVYDHTTLKLSYYAGSRTSGVYSRKAHISIPQTMVDLQQNGGNLTISGTFGGPGGATFSGTRLDRTGVDKFVAFTSALDNDQIAELFQSSDHTSLSCYSSVFACASLGEEAYPTVLYKKGQPPQWCALRRQRG